VLRPHTIMAAGHAVARKCWELTRFSQIELRTSSLVPSQDSLREPLVSNKTGNTDQRANDSIFCNLKLRISACSLSLLASAAACDFRP
jgi:hypothetical protein